MAIPTVEMFLWDVEELTPIPYRHIVSGAASFIKVLDTTVSGQLDWGRISVDSTSGGLSKTFAVTFRKKRVGTSGDDASIQNMRFWMPNYDAIVNDLDKISILYWTSGIWSQGRRLSYQDANVKLVPSSLPNTQNLFRQDSSGAITSGNATQNTFLDADASEFIYLAIQPSSTFPVGSFGFDSDSGVLFRVTWDYIGDLNIND